MHTPLGAHSPLVAEIRALKTKRGRRAARAYALEGATLLSEALDAGNRPRSLLGTAAALAANTDLVTRAAVPPMR